MAAFHFPIVPRAYKDESVCAGYEVERQWPRTASADVSLKEKTVGKFKTVVSLNAFHTNTAPGKPFDSSFKKVSRRVSTLFRVRCQKTQPRKFIDSCVLKKAEAQGRQYSALGLLLHRFECALRDMSFAHMALADIFSSVLTVQYV
jgi:hypothetical protein